MVANDPELKAKGVRCTFQDNLVNVFGNDPKTGFARSPFDNVGVQYGLQALNDGKITFDQFVDINSRVGGLDINGKIVPQRMVGDPLALRRAYETGRVNAGDGSATDARSSMCAPMSTVRRRRRSMQCKTSTFMTAITAWSCGRACSNTTAPPPIM